MLRTLTYFALFFSLLKFSYCTEIDDLPEDRNTIAVIGGGYTGVISAILLAKLKIFDVHLFEKDMVFMNGASAAPARLHLGGEYLEDEKTAKHCLFSAILFRQMLPTESIFTDIQYTKFLTAIDSLEDISIKTIQEQYAELQRSYERVFGQLSEIWGTTDEETGLRLFGHPSLLVEDTEFDPKFSHFAGGIKTKERGLQPIALGKILENLLEENNVQVHLGCTVTKAKYDEEKTGYLLSYKGQHSQKLFANYVVSAAWHRNNYLATKVDSGHASDTSQRVFLRTIGLFDVSQCENPKDCSYFGFKGEHGGMVSFYSPTVAAIYIPQEGLAYHGEVMGGIFLDRETQERWDDLNSNEGESRIVLKNMLDNAKEKYPFLEKAKPIKLLTRTTISQDGTISERSHIRPHWHSDGRQHWVEAESTKATYVCVTALQVLKKIIYASGLKRVLSRPTRHFLKSLDKLGQLGSESFIDSEEFIPDLPQEFILPPSDGDQAFLSKMQLYALKRTLPFEMMKEFSQSTLTPLERQRQLIGPEQRTSLIDPVRQISLIHWDYLEDVDLRSVTATSDMLRALTLAIRNREGSFKKFRFKYCDEHRTLPSPDQANAGANLLMALHGKLNDEFEIDRLFLTTQQESSAFISLLINSEIKKLTLTRFFPYTQNDEQRIALRNAFLLSLDKIKSLEEISILFNGTPSITMLKIIFSFQDIPNLKKLRVPHNNIGASLGGDNGVRNFKQIAKFIKESQQLDFLDLSHNELFTDGREEFEGFINEALHRRTDLKVLIKGNSLNRNTSSPVITPPKKRLRISRSLQIYFACDNSYDNSIDSPIKIHELFHQLTTKALDQGRPIPERSYTISNADKIIVLGSPEFKSNYDKRMMTREQIGRTLHDMDTIRIRIFEKDAGDIIPIHFVDLGEFQECFSTTINNLSELTLTSMYYEGIDDDLVSQLLAKLYDGY